MDKINRASWLRGRIDDSIKNISEDRLWKHLLQFFDVDSKDVAQTYFDYEYDVYSFGNEIYNSLEIRFVLYLLSKKPGSWHIKKQNIVDGWLSKLWPCDIVDIGFGVPQKYHLNKIGNNGNGSITLVEYNQLALEFAKAMFLFYQNKISNISLLNGKFFESPIKDKLKATPKVWIFLDSLEHFDSPEEILEECISASGNEILYIFSLPLGERVPVHTCSWEDKGGAFEWVKKQNLQILDFHILKPNPEIEWFIHSLQNYKKMKELLILAIRK